ncbi:SGNH/GDSL hydrolase family protein [Dactylosporangium vinaceum]|uniref:SGNH/GDSL hydrolase family protein n=1 Tax=Dactylosporangium vinaceum TaxID=53362 RepID=A0ABV5M5U3_9ACTN|nr:SGNH/GDSL hydrolase family protein [Dactylosporangium vinaceum]UAC01264.1 SGNH/GDSL hydrolase family protein [Dactylosporangium vinaceum]
MRRSRLVRLALGAAAALGVTFGLGSPAFAAASDRYVALGDSYASGVGADNYTSEGGACLRSNNAYPALYNAGVKPAAYRSVACSGATTADVINSQLSALSSSTTLVSVTIGGNDIGFTSIMTTCVLSGESDCIAAINTAEAKVRNELPAKLAAVYSGIRSRSPSARVVVVGYPVFYQLGTVCVGLSANSRAKINEGIDLLDDTTRTAAAAAGFRFADVRSIFVGHQLCSYGDKWLHALNFVSLTVSYHPTAAGQSGGYYPTFRTAAG